MKKALFPGTFDPISLGHMHIINQASKVFDFIFLGIGVNSKKKTLFSSKERKGFLNLLFKNQKNIVAIEYDSLTVDFCKKNNIYHVIRGVRNYSDFESELSLSQNNLLISNQEINTWLIPPSSETNHISSSIIRDIILNKGEIKHLVPEAIYKAIYHLKYENN